MKAEARIRQSPAALFDSSVALGLFLDFSLHFSQYKMERIMGSTLRMLRCCKWDNAGQDSTRLGTLQLVVVTKWNFWVHVIELMPQDQTALQKHGAIYIHMSLIAFFWTRSWVNFSSLPSQPDKSHMALVKPTLKFSTRSSFSSQSKNLASTLDTLPG